MPHSPKPAKLFAGAQLRRLREQHGLSQARLAGLLGLSASYFNQIEQDQRPLPQPMLRSLCTRFDVDVTYFGDSEELHQIGALREAVADPLFGELPVSLSEIQAMVRAAPGIAHRFLTLYRHHLEREEQMGSMQTRDTNARLLPMPTHFPYDEVRDWVQTHRNYFDALDRAAEQLFEREGFASGTLRDDLARVLRDRHAVVTENHPGLLQQGLVWRRDRDRGKLFLAEGASPESCVFWMAHTLGQLEQKRMIDRMVREADLSTEEARSLARIGLGNYYAGALMMPYGRFLDSARAARHDIQLLQSRFGASFEQICHRLSTMQRPAAPGIPFYFVKTDIAGNVLKRASATRFEFAHFGGPCPLWNVYRSFTRPNEVLVQLARTPDEVTYLNIARTVGRSGGFYLSRPRAVAVVLGCEIRYAPEVVYAAGLDLTKPATADPIGPGCRACQRVDCRHRAEPAIGQLLDVGTGERGVVPYRIKP